MINGVFLGGCTLFLRATLATKELGTWTPRRTENCAKRQLALLFAALRAAKLYGRIACSLKAGRWPVGALGGWIVLRDGWGPIYISTKLELFEEGVEDLEELEETDGEPLLLLPGPES
ncbi:hypothetical protein SELMODRAFT_410642 [Selaginella moellendorffii]|uniref:Uncharacterized protein n=1 Tax=Selaginella moellendorffii TaxID=88036 RepID=D8RFE0_SELML|nr:hypothetical protein SELMODRAFT_410642 [Selaginella moellendorffii]